MVRSNSLGIIVREMPAVARCATDDVVEPVSARDRALCKTIIAMIVAASCIVFAVFVVTM